MQKLIYRKQYYWKRTIPNEAYTHENEKRADVLLGYDFTGLGTNTKISEQNSIYRDPALDQINVQYDGILPSLNQSLHRANHKHSDNDEMAPDHLTSSAAVNHKLMFSSNSQFSVDQNRPNAHDIELTTSSGVNANTQSNAITSLSGWNLASLDQTSNAPPSLSIPSVGKSPSGSNTIFLPALEPDTSFESEGPPATPAISRGRLLLNVSSHSIGEEVTVEETTATTLTSDDNNNQMIEAPLGGKCTEKPERLKRPPNAFLLYNRDMRHRLLDQNPNLKVAEISKTISKQWKNLTVASIEERAPYHEEAAGLKQKHLDDHPNFVYSRRSKAELEAAGHRSRVSKKRKNYGDDSQSPESSKEPEEKIRDPRGRKKKRLKDPTAPKHPMSGFLFFSNSVRSGIASQNPSLSMGAVSKIIANRWNDMMSEARAPWLNKADEDKARYKREIQAYSASMASSTLKAIDQ
ncbi:hypothetical protein DFQ30_000335 [Apophysomyces sp. BC1015]|nr:hypothetical protein DFQ30_000335 [Apophysomyces sp. BC1015]